MKLFPLGRAAILFAAILLVAGLFGCTEMKEGETDVPGRVTRGLQGGGQFGGSPSGVFEPR